MNRLEQVQSTSQVFSVDLIELSQPEIGDLIELSQPEIGDLFCVGSVQELSLSVHNLSTQFVYTME